MSGMEPVLIGAALGGGVSAARGGNPLQGALLGGVTGGIGGSLWNTAGDLAKTAALDTAANPANYLSPTSFMGVAKQLPSALQSMATQNPLLAMGGLQMASNMMQPDAPMQAPQAMPMQTRGLQDAPIGGILAQQMQRQPISLI